MTKRRPAGALRIIAGLLLDVVVVVCLTGFAFLAVGPQVLGYRTATMLTGSMRGSVPTGSVVVDTPEALSELRVGQIITFQAPLADKRVVTHRIIEIQHTPAGIAVRTKGDANNGADPWTARLTGTTVWRVRAVIPHLGTLIRSLSGRSAQLLATLLLPALLCAWVLHALWQHPTNATEGVLAPHDAATVPNANFAIFLPAPRPPMAIDTLHNTAQRLRTQAHQRRQAAVRAPRELVSA